MNAFFCPTNLELYDLFRPVKCEVISGGGFYEHVLSFPLSLCHNNCPCSGLCFLVSPVCRVMAMLAWEQRPPPSPFSTGCQALARSASLLSCDPEVWQLLNTLTSQSHERLLQGQRILWEQLPFCTTAGYCRITQSYRWGNLGSSRLNNLPSLVQWINRGGIILHKLYL